MTFQSSLLSQNRDYRAWFIGDTGAAIGSQLTSLAFVLLAYTVTLDLVQAGLVGSVNAAARFICIIPGGTIVDHFPKKTLMKIYATLKIALMISLCFLIFTETINLGWLVAVAIASGLLSGTFGGLTNALLPFIVEGDDLQKALITNETRDSIVSVGSAPLGGALFGLSPTLPFLTDAVSYLALFWSGGRIKANVDAPPQADEKLRSKLSGGLRWVASRLDIVLILILLTVSNIGNFLVIASVELEIQKDGHPGWILGLVFSFFSLGMIVGGLVANRIQQAMSSRAVATTTFATQVGCYTLLSLTTQWYLIAAVLFVVTIPVIAMNSVLGAYQMRETPDDLQGRVGTVFMFVIGVGPVATGSLAGLLLAHFGWGAAILAATGFCAIALLITLSSKQLQKLNA